MFDFETLNPPFLILIAPLFGATLGAIGLLTNEFGIKALKKQRSLKGWKQTLVNTLLLVSFVLYMGTVIIIYMINMKIKNG